MKTYKERINELKKADKDILLEKADELVAYLQGCYESGAINSTQFIKQYKIIIDIGIKVMEIDMNDKDELANYGDVIESLDEYVAKIEEIK